MQASHQIQVKLTSAGRNILGADWATLDLPIDFSFQMSKDVLTLNTANKFTTESVLPFEIDQTKVNDAALIMYDSPLTLDNRNLGMECRVIADGQPMDFDYVYFVEKDQPNRKWILELRRSVKNWAELASEKKLNTINLGVTELFLGTVIYGWETPGYVDGESVVRWFPVDYGNWVDLSEPIQFTDPPEKGVFLEDLRPFISPVAMLKQGFCELGIQLDGLIFETAFLRQSWCYLLKRNFYSESRGGERKVILRKGSTDDFTLGGSNYFPILETVVEFDPGSIARNWQPADPEYGAGLENTFEYKATFKFCFSGTFVAPNNGPTTIKFQVEEFTTVATQFVLVPDAYEFSMLTDEVRPVSFCVDVVLEPGQKAFITMSEWRTEPTGNTVLKGGHRFVGEPNMKSFVRGDVFEISKVIHPDYTLLDLFKGVIHEMNGHVSFDRVQSVLSVFPYRKANVYGETVPGFIIDGELIDVRPLQVCNSEKTEPIKTTLKRYTRYSYADAKDSYIDSLKLIDPPFSRRVLNGIELPNEVEEIKNPFFEPTMERQSTLLKKRFLTPLGRYAPTPFFPVLTDNDSGARSFAIGPRILFFAGQIGQIVSEASGDLQANFYFEGKESGDTISLIPWAGHKQTFKPDPDFLPVLNASRVYGSQADDLFVLFYLGSTVAQKRGMFLNLLLLIGSSEYEAWDFRIEHLVDYLGLPCVSRLQAIMDFRTGSDLTTPIRYFIEPSDTECCDGPCSCVFLDCRYYSDFGLFITQETIDDLSITSFKVDEKEFITAPVGFGLVNTIQQGNGLYITNLVDALNSLAIPYFTFAYSPDIYTPKAAPRYFRIKRPICQTFEIIISDGDGEVYKYTDVSQEQKWFSGTWSPFGYGGDTTDEPEDCLTSTEY